MRALTLILALVASSAFAAETAQTAIRAVLDKQVADWNRADIPAFVMSYAEDCTFVGKELVQGRRQVEERYRKNYATPETMGSLTFSELKIKQIAKSAAVVTGTFHLLRSASGGGEKSGIFSLVFVCQAGVWRIVLDHTS